MESVEKIVETTDGQADLMGNELVVTDKGVATDPVAFRGRSNNGGMVKFGGDYYGQELGYLFIKRDERHSNDPSLAAGAAELWVRKPDTGSTDAAMVKRLEVRHDGVVLYDAWDKPVVFGGGGTITGRVALRTHHGKYLCVEPDGTIVANRDHAGPWETFQVVAM